MQNFVEVVEAVGVVAGFVRCLTLAYEVVAAIGHGDKAAFALREEKNRQGQTTERQVIFHDYSISDANIGWRIEMKKSGVVLEEWF
ncbi:hypothetical protein GCM10011511_19060 [Puia dinghuensis]|uniref:Uncharacterized protein n=1 Tax=Puia dinghuensis TaxID=1792502 RepID=A0A8J2UCK9_9BACT|nr:hypothetical protein GCM10011511_19060 [Puia dinghuensis]